MKFKVFLFIIPALFIFTNKVFCFNLEEKVLKIENYAVNAPCTISPDSKWLIYFYLETEENKIIAIDIGSGEEKGIVYLDGLFPIENISGFYWNNNENLVLLEEKNNNWYSLEIKDKVEIKKLDNFKIDRNKISYSLPFGLHVPKRFDISGFELKKGKITSNLFWQGRKVVSYSARFGLFGIQSPDVEGTLMSPNGQFILYTIEWYGGVWNVGPIILYCLDTKTNKVFEIDDNFPSHLPSMMIWRPDNKGFIYNRKAKNQESEIREEIVETILKE